MSGDGPERSVLDLAGSVADGEVVDWEAELAVAGEDTQVLKNLGRLASIARVMREVHQGADAESEPQVPGYWGHLMLQETLGRGSFGTVYRAFDPVLRREVAVKLRHGRSGGPSTSQWIAEARRLARVRHPNVLAVHGANVHDGIAGLWSDRVEGRTLAEVIDAEGPLPAARVVGIAMQLVRAVAAVHEAGLVHGDIKPANIMLETDDRGRDRTVLMDFGAGAEASSDSEAAGFGSPLVMAPEMFSGQPSSQATDAYAVGVVMYFVLCGDYPLRASTLEGLVGRHRRARWPDPCGQRRGIPRRLARLVRQLGAHKPQERPGMSEALAELERVRDAPRRRRKRAVIASVIALLAIGLAAALAGYYRAQLAERETEAVNQFLLDVLASPRPIESGPQTRVVEVLDRAAERLDSETGAQPRVRARMLAIVGRTYATLGRYTDAEPLLREALQLRQELLGADHPDAIALMEWIGDAERETGRMVEAEATFQAMRDLADALDAPGHALSVNARIGLASVRMRQSRFDSAESALQEALAMRRGPEWADDPAGNLARMTYGELLRMTSRYDEADFHLREALEWSLEHNGERHSNTLVARHNLVASLTEQGRLEAAEPLARQNVEVAREWLGEMDRYLGGALSAYSNVLYDLGRHDEAMQANARALEIVSTVFGPTHINTLHSRANQANRYMEIGEMATAEAEYREVDHLASGELGDAHPLVLMNRYNLAELYYRTGRDAEALEQAASVHERMREALGEEHLFTLVAGGLVGASLSRLGRVDEAEAHLGEIIERQLQVMGESHPYTLQTRFYRAENLARMGRAEEARVLAREVLELRTRLLGAEHPGTREVAEWLAARREPET